MSETFATVGVFLTEDERKHLVRLCEELEALEESALRNNEGPEAQTRAAERAALRKLMFMPLSGPAGHVGVVVATLLMTELPADCVSNADCHRIAGMIAAALAGRRGGGS